jgi:hypothetical protein
MTKQLALFAAAHEERSPAVFVSESIKSELLALITRAIVETYQNQKKGESYDEGNSEQDQRRAS